MLGLFSSALPQKRVYSRGKWFVEQIVGDEGGKPAARFAIFYGWAVRSTTVCRTKAEAIDWIVEAIRLEGST